MAETVKLPSCGRDEDCGASVRGSYLSGPGGALTVGIACDVCGQSWTAKSAGPEVVVVKG